MGKSSDASKNPIQANTYTGHVGQQQEISAVLLEMTGGKYRTQSILGTGISDRNAFLFNTKGELKKAKVSVKKAQNQINNLLDTLKELTELELCEKLDQQIKNEIRKRPLETAFSLVLDNAARAGATNIISELSNLLHVELEKYNKRIIASKADWPKGKNKSKPVVVARSIAEVYVIHMGMKPSYGTNENGPSTAYSKAVESIFQILGIESNSDEAAKYAAKECTPEKIDEVLKVDASSKKSASKRALMRSR